MEEMTEVFEKAFKNRTAACDLPDLALFRAATYNYLGKPIWVLWWVKRSGPNPTILRFHENGDLLEPIPEDRHTSYNGVEIVAHDVLPEAAKYIAELAGKIHWLHREIERVCESVRIAHENSLQYTTRL